ncbi:MAG TPA: M56 family metallopeptidase [Terriglobia bacterium]|nr:M56 family metallopeptidase [Terriglobia bacterium]
MMPELSLQNFLSWALQVSVIALTGAVLPAIFRIHHPRSHLAWCYVLLLASIMLPLIQPWHQPAASGATASHPEPADTPHVIHSTSSPGAAIQWRPFVGWILLAGIVARLCWFLAGLYQIQRYRAAATPLRCLSEPVRWARKLTNRDGLFCISAGDIGPVTFGFFRPIILLPESFLTLKPDAQCAIVCHELLHVKRKDWFVTVIEELIGACLWFHPAVWWLLSQTKLAREQIVDAEVIRLTAAPDPYIDVLLAMAGARTENSLVPAPLFLHKNHLVRRLRSLLIDCPISTLRLMWSYASMAAVVAVTGCLALTSFPLMGQPQIEKAVVSETVSSPTPGLEGGASMEGVFRVGGGVTAPKLITHVDPEYSDEAREALTQGTVVVQAVVQPDGTMSVARILRSLNPELDQNALRAMKQWRFEPGTFRGVPVPVELDVEVSFKLRRG